EGGGRGAAHPRGNGPAAGRVRGHQAAERRRSGAAVQPMMHRFAYVGNDLQDLFGINPRTIGTATPMSDAFFQGGNATAVLAALAARPDAVLVSEETVLTYQVRMGDLLRLRVQSARDHAYHLIPFHFVGVVREFPTAPKDSFFIANASYIARDRERLVHRAGHRITGVPGHARPDERLAPRGGPGDPARARASVRGGRSGPQQPAEDHPVRPDRARPVRPDQAGAGGRGHPCRPRIRPGAGAGAGRTAPPLRDRRGAGRAVPPARVFRVERGHLRDDRWHPAGCAVGLGTVVHHCQDPDRGVRPAATSSVRPVGLPGRPGWCYLRSHRGRRSRRDPRAAPARRRHHQGPLTVLRTRGDGLRASSQPVTRPYPVAQNRAGWSLLHAVELVVHVAGRVGVAPRPVLRSILVLSGAFIL